MNPLQDDGGGSKKAVHVKWAGKTIALGTFPSAEADEKCARAKALTRAWRSTIRPKPTREWVMNELERLGVRIVSGKLGRKAEDDDGGGGGERGNMTSNENFPMAGGMDAAVTQERPSQQRRDSGAGLGSTPIAGTGSLGGIPPATSGQQVNQHYEMLKLHHMNLLQELHETTMMMNMYQQQQLQQEQLRLQQASNGDQQLANSMGQRRSSLGGGGMDGLFGSQRGSLGLGMASRGSLGLGSGMGGVGSLGFGGGGGAKSEMAGLTGMKRNNDDGGEGGMKRQKMNPGNES